MNKKIITLIALSTVLAGYFYWYQWRPTEIKKLCAEAVKRGSPPDLIEEFGRASGSDFYDDIYKQCLRLKGL